MTSKRSGKERRCELVCEKGTVENALSEREPTAYLPEGGGGVAIRAQEMCQLVLPSVSTGLGCQG